MRWDNKTSKMQKVLYIAGYGRSGSTILDVILGNHPDVISAGELTYLVDEWHAPERRCACGSPYTNCSFWRELPESVSLSEKMARVVRQIESRHATLPFLLNDFSKEKKETYRRFQNGVFSYLTETADTSIVVDSSKSAGDAAMRLYALSHLVGLDVYVLHLVRDGRATLASLVRNGRNWALEGHAEQPFFPGMRAIAGWTLANLWVLGLSRKCFCPDRYLRVRFEDLVAHPETTLETIGDYIGINAEGLIDRAVKGCSFNVGHNVGGNRIRHQQSIRLRTNEVSGREPWSHLDAHYRSLFAICGQWLNWKLGYSW